jgi:hypothetical protein
VLLGRRGRVEEQARARDTAAMRWRLGGARVGVARAGKASGGGKPGRERGRATHGACPSRRWRRGGIGVAVSSTYGRGGGVEGRAGEQSRCQRKKKRERGPRDLLGICKNLRDLTVN